MPAARPRSLAWTAPVAAFVVFVGLAVIALASRGGPVDATAAAYDAPNVERYTFVGFLLAAAIATGLIVWVMWPDGRAGVDRAPTSWWRQYAVSLVVLFLLVGLGGLPVRVEHREAPDRSPEAGRSPDDDPSAGRSTWPRASGTATVALAVVVGAGIGASALVRLARRRVVQGDTFEDSPGPDGPRPDDGTAAAVPVGLDEADIAAEADPRRAVLLAYALLERRLTASPVARRASTSPQEWLLDAARWGPPGLVAPFRTLTALYEQARFSVRPLTPEDQATAVAALRDALAQPSTSSAGAG